jgi:hypothetical protein
MTQHLRSLWTSRFGLPLHARAGAAALFLTALLLAGFAPAHAQAPIWVLDARGGTGAHGRLFSVDPRSGTRLEVSNFGAGDQGPQIISPVGVAVAP